MKTKKLFGTKQNGVELRWDDAGELDEILIYVNGIGVFHSERMDDKTIWFGIDHFEELMGNFWIKDGRLVYDVEIDEPEPQEEKS